LFFGHINLPVLIFSPICSLEKWRAYRFYQRATKQRPATPGGSCINEVYGLPEPMSKLIIDLLPHQFNPTTPGINANPATQATSPKYQWIERLLAEQ
jgi:hypothetical protein